MAEMQDFDADGFKLKFDKDVSADERDHYIKSYPNVDQVLDAHLHCTSCQKHFGAAPSKLSAIQMHPVLRTTQCKKCYTFYNSGEFDKGEDGSELYCRWCGQGGEVYCCSNCPYVFCQGCITSNFSSKMINEIEKNDTWECFRCDPRTLWDLRARHWALMNYLEKKKTSIIEENKGDDEEIYDLMGVDDSKCCTAKSSSRRSTSSSSTAKRKRIHVEYKEKDDNDSDSSSTNHKSKQPKKKKQSESADDYRPPASTDHITVADIPSGDIVCTPDIMSMFSPPLPNDEIESNEILEVIKPVRVAKKQKIVVKPYTIKPTNTVIQPPSQGAIPGNLIETDRQVVTLPTPKAAPVFHTINGYTIDLNSAAKQDTFRLPNGKLIQVKKQANSTTSTSSKLSTRLPASNPRPSTSTSQPPTSIAQLNRNFRPRSVFSSISQRPQGSSIHLAPNNTGPTISINNMPQIRHIGYSSNTLTPQQVALQSVHIQQQQQLLNSINLVPPSTAGAYQQPSTAAPSAPTPFLQPSKSALMQLQQIQVMASGLSNDGHQQPQLQPASTVKPGCVRVKTKFPNTAVGRARGHFEGQIFAAQDLCHHIIGKLNSLMKSNAYKTAASFADVKDLQIHLSYLYTYTMDRVRTLQDKSQDDIKRLEKAVNEANNAADKRAKYVNDEDDLKIVEQPRTCIEIINSDDECEETPVAPPNNAANTQHSSSPPPLRPILISSVRSATVPSLAIRSTASPAARPSVDDEPPTAISDEDEEHELPLPPEIALTETSSPEQESDDPKLKKRTEVVVDIIQDISDEENELPLPPVIQSVSEMPQDPKLRQSARVVIERLENINPLFKEKLDQRIASHRATERPSVKLNDENESIANKNTDDLVELIEVDDENDNDEICWADSEAEQLSKSKTVEEEETSNGKSAKESVEPEESDKNPDGLVELIDVDDEHDACISDTLPGKDEMAPSSATEDLLISSVTTINNVEVSSAADDDAPIIPESYQDSLSLATTIEAIDDLIDNLLENDEPDGEISSDKDKDLMLNAVNDTEEKNPSTTVDVIDSLKLIDDIDSLVPIDVIDALELVNDTSENGNTQESVDPTPETTKDLDTSTHSCASAIDPTLETEATNGDIDIGIDISVDKSTHPSPPATPIEANGTKSPIVDLPPSHLE